MLAPLEVGKYYQTRSGDKVRIYTLDGGGEYPIHGAIFDKQKGTWRQRSFTSTGRSTWMQEGVVDEWPEKPEFDWSKAAAWHNWLFWHPDKKGWYVTHASPQDSCIDCMANSQKSMYCCYMCMCKVPSNYAPAAWDKNWKSSIIQRPVVQS